MPDPQDAQQMLEALALTGATTVVAAMATDAWQAARARTVRLFHHRTHDFPAVEAQLEGDAVVVARDEDAEAARQELVGPWRRRLVALLREDPDAAAELTALIHEVRRELPQAQRSWVQTNTAHGHGIVNAVQHGSQHNYYPDSAPPERHRGTATGEPEA
jgi:hypothetical protein